MDEYLDIEGVFTYVVIWRHGKKSSRKLLGWQPDKRILWLIPSDSSFRSDHVTGSNRSRPLFVDSIESMRRVDGVRQGLEIRVRQYEEEEASTSRILESRRQGRTPEVEHLLRTAWRGWNPKPLPPSGSTTSRQLVFVVDGAPLPTGTSLSIVAMWHLRSPEASPDWTLTIEEVKRRVEEKYGKDFQSVDSFEIEIFGHTLAREYRSP